MKLPHGLALAGFGASLVIIPTPAGVAADYDAAYVSMTVPARVQAGAVFAVTVTLRNRGTQPWEGWPIRLRSLNPTNNTVWGTDYILIAQGSVVQPGGNYAFRSNLRAPRQTGPANFQWQVCKDASLWFGESTPPLSVEVLAGPPAPGTRMTATRVPNGPSVLHSTDLEYVGSFKPPKTVGEARGAFSERGDLLRRQPIPFRGHHVRGVRRLHPLEQMALRALAGHDRQPARFAPTQRVLPVVEPQLALLLVGSVAFGAPLDEDRLDVTPEVDLGGGWRWLTGPSNGLSRRRGLGPQQSEQGRGDGEPGCRPPRAWRPGPRPCS
jgi:hypothetical protein